MPRYTSRRPVPRAYDRSLCYSMRTKFYGLHLGSVAEIDPDGIMLLSASGPIEAKYITANSTWSTVPLANPPPDMAG